MWRWTVFLCLIFYGHTSPQPVTDDNENARQARQLGFGECCPCPGPGQGLAAQESSISNGDAMFSRARDIEDCPCSPRNSDSEEASSIFFPTSMRSDGNFVRHVDRKEDFKPLLHPEVDLASSVLQTIREATDEEYQDALARDAARSMAKASHETILGDTVPEANSIVTIIVNPKHAESLDDVIPQETNVQESRYIHAPLESVNTNLDQIPVAQKPPSLLREIFGLPKISKDAGLLHNNLLDMDSGASNIQERLEGEHDQVTNEIVLGLKKHAPLMKFDTNIKDKSTNMKSNLDVNTSVKKVPDFKLPSMKNKLKDLIANRTALESKVKTNSLPLIPKMKFNNPLFTVKGKNEKDQSLSPSSIHEQAKKSFFQTKSHLENILQNTKPVGLKTLLKLKDVEFVPIKDLVPKEADKTTLNRTKLIWPDIFKKRETMISTNKAKNPINVARSTEIIEKIPKSSQDETLDAEVSPSNVFEQINNDNCNNRAFKTTDDEDGEDTEIIDTASSPSEIEKIVSDTSNDFANSQSNEVPDNTDDCNIKTFPVTETNLPQSMENSVENEAQGNNEDELNFETSKEITPLDAKAEDDPEFEFVSNDEDCFRNTNDADSITDSSNNANNVLKPSDIVLENVDDSLVNKNTVIEEDCNQEVPFRDNSKTIKDTGSDFAKSPSNEVPDNTEHCNIKTLPVTETNLPQSVESSFENETQGNNNEEELNFETSKEITPLDAKAEDDSESEIVSNDEDCFRNTNDADSITDSSNNTKDVLKPNDIVLENVDDSLVNENTVIEDDCSQELPVSHDSKTLGINPTKLIKPRSMDETLSTIKEKIANHIENLKNPKIYSKSKFLDSLTSRYIVDKEASPITEEKLDSDCQNKESIQVTTVKPDICNNDLMIESKPDDDKVTMQDLQKISDEMLQEEQERESKTFNCSELKQEVTVPKIPTVVNTAENENTDSEQSANTPNEVIMDPQNIDKIIDENDNDVKNTCQSDLTLPKKAFEQQLDANVEASEVVINRTPQGENVFTSPLLLNKVLQPNENDFSLNIPLPDIQDIKLVPLPTLDEIKLSFTNLFDKPARDVEEHSASEAASMIDTSNILAPIMSTDASAKHFQSMLLPLRLEDVDFNILQLKPQSNLFPKIPKLDLHSFRTKLPLPTDLRIKPLKLQSAFEDKGGLLAGTLSLGRNNPWGTIPDLGDFETRVKANTQKIVKTLRKPDSLRHSLKSSSGIGDFSDTKNNLRSMQHSLESKFRGATTKPVNLQSIDLLEALSRNHEDVNDKLRALHVDFNDRLETMRNNLFDKSIFGSGESRSTKSFSTFSNKNKDKKISLKASQPQLSRMRESKKTLKPRRLEQQRETRIGSSHGLQNKFKMPTAASVSVPRTIEVPELKATRTKSPGLGIQRASGVNPIFQNISASQPKESSITLWKQASKKLPITNTRLGKTMNRFKDSKINVSFSTTTPRPSLSTKLQSRKLSTPPSLSLTSSFGKNTGRLGQRLDHNGSPSEMKHSIISRPISSHLEQNNLENYGLESKSRQTGTLSTWKLDGSKNLKQPKISKDLQSWPKVSESAFLSKVKEAVKTRMSKVNSPVTLKQADRNSVSTSFENGEVINSNTDMGRSASTNIDVIEGQALKENVSYKCTMVCTRE